MYILKNDLNHNLSLIFHTFFSLILFFPLQLLIKGWGKIFRISSRKRYPKGCGTMHSENVKQWPGQLPRLFWSLHGCLFTNQTISPIKYLSDVQMSDSRLEFVTLSCFYGFRLRLNRITTTNYRPKNAFQRLSLSKIQGSSPIHHLKMIQMLKWYLAYSADRLLTTTRNA